MIKKVLSWIAAGLAVLVATLLFLYLNRSDPWGIIPGKQLTDKEVTGPIDDWSFALQYSIVTNEVRPSDPYSVNSQNVVLDGVLYIPSGGGGESRWAQFLLQDPNMRIRVGNKLYKVRATRVEDPALMERVREAFTQQHPRPMGRERTPEQLARTWFFQIDSR